MHAYLLVLQLGTKHHKFDFSIPSTIKSVTETSYPPFSAADKHPSASSIQ